jgi:PAS domain S-box-containing protein
MKEAQPLNVAIVGGGPGCIAIMDMMFAEKLSQLRMKLVGVACTNPKAAGYRYAQEKGVHTTRDYRDLYGLEDLGMIIELTGRDEAANEIARTKPSHVRLMDHVSARLFWDIFQIEEERVQERKRSEEALRASENRYRNVYDTAPLAFVIWDRECNITGWNDRAEQMFGWSREEVAGANFFEFLIPEKARPRVEDVVEKLLAGKVEPDVVNENLTKSGEIILCRWNNSILYDSEGKIIGAMSLALDITEQHKAQDAILESEAKYSSLVQKSLTGIFIHQDEKYVFVNDRFAEIHGYQPGELLGQDPWTLIHSDERNALRPVLSKRLKGESVPNQYEVRRLRKDGSTIWCEMMATRIEHSGRPAIMGNIVDINKRKRAEEALQESEQKYREVVERANDGIAIIQDALLKYGNRCLTEITGYTLEEAVDTPFTNYVWPDEVAEATEDYRGRMAGEPVPIRYERGIRHKNGSRIDAEISGGIITYQNRPANLVIIRDITDRKRAEEALHESTSKRQVAYEQAIIYAQELNDKINECKLVEETLRQRKEELKNQAQNLEELNTALKVVLKRRDEDRVELEEKVVSNVKELVLPYVETLKKARLDARQTNCVSIIQANLNEILSPFLRKFSSQYLRLTPKEIQIADLIKLGKTSKEIAEMLDLSTDAIKFHRDNIRAKLGLKNQPINLRTHLLSLC